MSLDSKGLEAKYIETSPIPGSKTAPVASRPAHIPEINPKPLDLNTLLIQPIHSIDGEQKLVVLYRIKDTLNKLVKAHNTLVERFQAQEPGEYTVIIDELIPCTEEDLRIITNVVKRNQTFELVGWLYAIRYTCNCVNPLPYWGRYTYWCSKCNRLVQEND